jgi:predicted GIY-YIG superfamily endonuclease
MLDWQEESERCINNNKFYIIKSSNNNLYISIMSGIGQNISRRLAYSNVEVFFLLG